VQVLARLVGETLAVRGLVLKDGDLLVGEVTRLPLPSLEALSTKMISVTQSAGFSYSDATRARARSPPL